MTEEVPDIDPELELAAQCVEDAMPSCTPEWAQDLVQSILEAAAERIRDLDPPGPEQCT